MKKLCFIVPYFGSLPNYFSFWLESCRNNPSVNWLLFTDNAIDSLPSNVKHVYISFGELKTLFQSRFDFNISLDSPYKLCDFRPTYGYVFSDYIKDFDFWGHCDIDLIWGNIRHFVTDELLDNYDKIFNNGHCVLYRNSKDVNEWFKTLPPMSEEYRYDVILSSKMSYAFDEFGGKNSWGGMIKMTENAGKRVYIKEICDDVSASQYNFRIVRPYEDHECFTREQKSKIPCYFVYDKAALSRCLYINNKWEVIESFYVHFQKRLMEIKTDNYSKYIIVPNRFDKIDLDERSVLKACRYRYIYWHHVFLRFNNLINKINDKIKRITWK